MSISESVIIEDQDDMSLTSLIKCVKWESVISQHEDEEAVEYASVYSSRMGPLAVRKIGPPCPCGCFKLMGQRKVEDIFNAFWTMTDEEQNEYINKQVQVLDVRRSRVKNRPSRRKKTLNYWVSTCDSEVYKVCSRAFRNMHGISQRRVRTVLHKVTNGHEYCNHLTG